MNGGMDDLVRIKMEHLLIAVNGTKGPIRTGGILSLRVKCEPREPAAKQPLSARDGFSPLWAANELAYFQAISATLSLRMRADFFV